MRIVYLFLLLVSVSCSKNKLPENVVTADKMQAVLWDVVRADVLTTDYHTDSLVKPLHRNIELQKKIFRFHKISKEQFYKSFEYYSDHPELMTTMLDSMLVQENRRRNAP